MSQEAVKKRPQINPNLVPVKWACYYLVLKGTTYVSFKASFEAQLVIVNAHNSAIPMISPSLSDERNSMKHNICSDIKVKMNSSVAYFPSR